MNPSPGLTIDGELARSPRTVLYRAREDADATRPVLLKVSQVSPDDERILEQLENELAMSQRLQTQAVVKVYRRAQHNDRPALVLEDFGGLSLDKLLGPPMPLEQFFPFALRITEALAEVHQAGIVHKDLKPSNIIVDRSGTTAKITDFGIARLSATGRQTVAMPGAMDGTPAYMSPEQTGRMNRGVDFRSDLYSLGITFYEMLTGNLPFSARDTLEWVHSHIAKTPEPPASVVRSIPAAVSALVMKLIAKSVEDRYQTARGLADDLRRMAHRHGSGGLLDVFELGSHDVSENFQLSQRLYGRENEVEALVAAFDAAVRDGAPRVLKLGGFSGIGKSTLVQELYRPLVSRRGIFIGGKFDQLRKNVPYAAVAEALTALAHSLLTRDEEDLNAWRGALQAAVGRLGDVLLQLAPALSGLLGEQPPVPELTASEGQNRFNIVLQQFLAAVAKPEHPLVLFLDDVQWADTATLNLLQSLLDSGALGPTLVVLAFRDNEIVPGHPFIGFSEWLDKSAVPTTNVKLGSLPFFCVHQLVADTLHSTLPHTESLAELVIRKTDGNPFFVNEFLKALHSERLLAFQSESQTWSWNVERIEARSISDNVVDLMVNRLRKLPESTQDALKLAACIGGTFPLDMLALVSEQPMSSTISALGPALELGLVLPLPDGSGMGRRYRFGHDRIQQAAYALIDEEHRRAVHLKVGRLLAAGLDEAGRERAVFEVVNQLNYGLSLIDDADERARLLEMNVLAGKKAKAAVAYVAAARYLETAASMLAEDAWDSEAHALAFRIQRELAETEYLAGRLEDAQKRFDMLVERSHSLVEKGSIWELQMRLFQVAGDFNRAVATALHSFAAFGLPVPESDADVGAEVGALADKALKLRGNRDIAELVHAPLMTNPETQMLMTLLEASAPPFYMGRPAVFPWVSMQLAALSLEHGLTEASAYGYGVYAILLAASFGDVPAGYAFSKLAIDVNERMDDARLKGTVLHLFGDHVNFWKNHLATDLPILDMGFVACVEGGDLIYSNYIGFQEPWHAFESGMSIAEVLSLTTRYAAFARQSKHEPVHQTIRLEQSFLRRLQGLTPAPAPGGLPFDDEDFSEQAAFDAIEKAGFTCGVVYRHIMRQAWAELTGDTAGAWEASEKARPHLGAAYSMPIETSHFFYRGLTLAQKVADAKGAAPEEWNTELDAIVEKFLGWSKACEENFAHRHCLLSAERARARGDFATAMKHYEAAIVGARNQGFTHDEGLASERAARFYVQQGATSVAELHFRHTRQMYTKWGATALIQRIDRDHPGLAESRSTLTLTPARTTGSFDLDMMSVVRLSQTISGEMELSRLLTTLMRIIVEAAGAERGSLYLVDGDQFTLATAHDLNREATEKKQPTASTTVPFSILQWVRRTGQRVLLADASAATEFQADAYIRRVKPSSVLCLPMKRHTALRGVFYLENNLAAGVFSEERLAVLELLTAQAAISIDNSRLFTAVQDGVRLRDEFLGIASHELKTPLTPLMMNLQTILRRVTDGTLTPESVQKMVSTSQRQIVRIRNLIEDMLDVTALSAGKLSLTLDRFDLVATLHATMEKLRFHFEQWECQPLIDAPPSLEGVWDKQRIAQVMANVLHNAVKFSPTKPVHIRLWKEGERAFFSVRDEGIGIEASDIGRIFDRFERVRSPQNVGGMGLGLFIVRQVVEGHGGAVRAESTPGVGSTFTVSLPLQTPETAKPERVVH